MAFGDKMSKSYLDEDLIKEAMDFGGIHFNPAAQSLGYSNDPQALRTSVSAFANQAHPITGQKFLRQQKNSSKNFDCFIFAPSPSVRTYLSALPSHQQDIRQKILRDAYMAGADHLAAQEQIRRGAGGVRREPAQGVYMLVMHGSTRSHNPQSCDHGHVVFANFGISQEGKTYSVAGEERMKHLKDADHKFQMKLAEGLEKHLGVKVTLQNQQCTIPAVSQEAIQKCTGAKAREIQEKLKQAGLQDTPRNKRLANDILRQDAPKYSSFDGQKLQDQWRQAALAAQPKLLEDVKIKAGQRLDTIQQLAALQTQKEQRPAQAATAAVIRQQRQGTPQDSPAAQAAKQQQSQAAQQSQGQSQQRTSQVKAQEDFLKKTQREQAQQNAAQRRPAQTDASRAAETMEKLRQEQERTQAKQRREEGRQQQEKQKRRPFEYSERVRRHNEEQQRQRKDFQQREKSWISQQMRETWKTAQTIVKARFQGERKIIKVRDFNAFQEATRKRSIMEGHRAARAAVRSTRVKSFKHALEVAQEGYKQGRKPKLIPPKGSHVVLPEKMKLNVEQLKHLNDLKKKHNLKIHQGRQRDIDIARRLAEELRRIQEMQRSMS